MIRMMDKVLLLVFIGIIPVRSHFNIKNEFKLTHESGAEIKPEFFVSYVRRYQQNLILVVCENNTCQPEEENIDECSELINTACCEQNRIPCSSISEIVSPKNNSFIPNINPTIIAFENANSDINFVSNTTSYQVLDCQDIEVDEDAPPSKVIRTISCLGEYEFSNFSKNNVINNDKYDINDLQALLNKSVPEVLSKYNKNPTLLNNNDRIKVSKTIIHSILDNQPDTVLKRENFDELADKILNIFNKNTECKSVYYYPAEKGKSARGKLFDAYYNKKNLLSQAGLISRRKLTSKATIEYECTTTSLSQETDESEVISNSIEFLKNNVTPWPVIIEHWKNTHTRRIVLLNSKISTHEYIHQFLCLLEPKGLDLIEIDAKLRYPDIRPFSEDHFKTISEKIISKARTFKSSVVKNYLDILTDKIIVLALRDVKVTVPKAVQKGENAILICSYDMEGDSLYSVKWYKGRREFYRYTPKENPAMKVFQFTGIHVLRALSNESQVTLQTVSKSVSGKYSCEVSADAPSFHTMIFSGDLEVVEVPEHKPFITGIRPRYRIGDILRGNCTSKHSRPAANLTWLINDVPAAPVHVRQHKPYRDHRNPDLETSILGIHFVVTEQHFLGGKLKIKCSARIHKIYAQSTEKSIEEDRPRVFSAASSNNVKLIQSPYDQITVQDAELVDKKDTYMPIQGDMSSQNSGTSKILPINNLLGLLFITLLSSLISKCSQYGS